MFLYWGVQNTEVTGEGKIVESDETKIGKRKYNKGCHLGQCVFGGIERVGAFFFHLKFEM